MELYFSYRNAAMLTNGESVTMKTETWHFEVYTYDLLADGDGGKTVNDVYYRGVVDVKARIHPETGNLTVTDHQLNRAIGARGLTWDGDEAYTLYASNRHGDPVCELRRVNSKGE